METAAVSCPFPDRKMSANGHRKARHRAVKKIQPRSLGQAGFRFDIAVQQDEGKPMSREASPKQILEFAIERSLMVSTAYNRGRSILAPHSLFAKHDELYLRAVTIERDGRAPREARLGTFKLI